jgi:lipopolysaccharide export system permease protein
MRLLDRYLLRELLIPLGYCLSALLIFWISFDSFTELAHYQELKLHLTDVLEYYLVTIPEFLVLILPIAFLLALLYALTNHARHHELTAIRAAGVSLWRICIPYVVVGFVFSLAVLAINEFWVPDASERGEQIKNRRQDKKVVAVSKDIQPYFFFPNSRDGRTWQIEAYNLKTHIMTRPKVIWSLTNGTSLYIIADHGNYTNDVWTFYNVKETLAVSGTNSDMIPILQTNVLAFPEFSETPEQFKREVKFNKRLITRSAHSAEVPITDILDYLELHRDLPKQSKWWLQTQLQGRLASPWTCLVVVFIAIPFGAPSGRRNIFVGVASSIVICFAYFILLRLGLALGSGGYVPAWLAAWLPNLVFGTTGIWMMLRVR